MFKETGTILAFIVLTIKEKIYTQLISKIQLNNHKGAQVWIYGLR